MMSRTDKHFGLALPAMLGLLLAAPVAPAEVYRWTDAAGRVHYGSRPPPDVETRRIALPAGAPAAPPSADDDADRRDRQRRLLEVYDHERKQKKAAKAKARQAREQRLQRCQRLQASWRRLNSGGRVYVRRDDGGRDYLDDTQRAARLAELRPAYVAACGEPPPQ